MNNLTQEQLDEIIREVKGTAAVEEMVYEDNKLQRYQLSNGGMLTINRQTGRGQITFLNKKRIEF